MGWENCQQEETNYADNFADEMSPEQQSESAKIGQMDL